MLYVDIPTSREIEALNLVRADACISVYLKTTPITQEVGKCRIKLGNLVKQAMDQLGAVDTDKRLMASLQEQFDHLQEDDAFWEHQAHSLAILVSPEMTRTFRLANKLVNTLEVSDRFHLKPLLRATTFPHAAHVLALSENDVRLIEVSADLPATELKVAGMPKDADSAVGKASISDSGAGAMLGQKTRLAQYIRKVDAALRPVLLHSDVPVVLATTRPLESLFRSISGVHVLPDTIHASPDHMTPAELATAATPALDKYYQSQIMDFHRLFEASVSQERATTDIEEAARAATFSAIDRLMVDIDSVIIGTVDDETGEVKYVPEADAKSYGVVDEIAGRALRTGARVLAVRKADIPGNKTLAAVLRYAV